MTGGPKAERVRRVTSVSDGPVEVGWVPEHSAPTVKDRPLVMLQSLSQRDGRPLFRFTFDEGEAWELYASLAYVLEAEVTRVDGGDKRVQCPRCRHTFGGGR